MEFVKFPCDFGWRTQILCPVFRNMMIIIRQRNILQDQGAAVGCLSDGGGQCRAWGEEGSWGRDDDRG